MSQGFVPGPRQGTLHNYAKRLAAFEYSSQSAEKPHSLLFIAGLSDGLFTVPYLDDVVATLKDSNWSVFAVLLSSSYSGWGMSSLDKDVEEISQCVEYVKEYKASKFPSRSEPGQVVLMGHSTGSQDVLHYLYSQNPLPGGRVRSFINGGILQAPVSDREHVLDTLKHGNSNDSAETIGKVYREAVELARKNENTADGVDFVMPLSLTTRLEYPNDVPISSKRFLSLASPDSPDSPAPDDLFSSDLSDARLRETFGMIGSRGLLKQSLLVLYSGADEYAPKWIDKEQLMQRWQKATENGSQNPIVWNANSGVVTGASHSPKGQSQTEPRAELVSRVHKYISSIEQTSQTGRL